MISQTLEMLIEEKRLQVRPAEETDLAAIADLRANPAVAPFQYDPGPDHLGELKQCREILEEHPELHYGLFAISLDERFIGSLTMRRYLNLYEIAAGVGMEKRPISAGWDLHPEFWGKGYMSNALTLVFDYLFKENDRCLICSDCFANNERCIGLLNKLGFQPVRIPLIEKIQIKLVRRNFHKHLRFHLTKQSYENRPLLTR